MRPAASLLLSMALRWLVSIDHLAVLRRDNRQVGGRLHEAGDIGAHGQNAVVLAGQQPPPRSASASAKTCGGRAALSTANLQAGIERAEIRANSASAAATSDLQFRLCAASSASTCGGFARDGVALAAAGDLRDGEGQTAPAEV